MVLTRVEQDQNSNKMMLFQKAILRQNELNPCFSGLETFRSSNQIKTDLWLLRLKIKPFYLFPLL